MRYSHATTQGLNKNNAMLPFVLVIFLLKNNSPTPLTILGFLPHDTFQIDAGTRFAGP